MPGASRASAARSARSSTTSRPRAPARRSRSPRPRSRRRGRASCATSRRRRPRRPSGRREMSGERKAAGDELRARLAGSISQAPTSRVRRRTGGGKVLDIHQGRADYVSVKADLLARLLDDIGDRNLMAEDEEGVARVVKEFVARVLSEEDIPLNEQE